MKKEQMKADITENFLVQRLKEVYGGECCKL
jgi:hypothetical protein